jgi:hypothetical protein
MSLTDPSPFLTVAFGTPIDIGFLPRAADDGESLTVGWTAKLGTSFPRTTRTTSGSADERTR